MGVRKQAHSVEAKRATAAQKMNYRAMGGTECECKDGTAADTAEADPSNGVCEAADEEEEDRPLPVLVSRACVCADSAGNGWLLAE